LARRGIVFLGVPECAVVHWVDGQCAVIAPPVARADLAPRSIEESGFTLGQSVYGIGHQPAGVADLGVNRGAGGAKADSQVARLIHRRATHPAPGCVRLVGALLKDRRCGRHGAQLKPAHPCHAARTHGIIAHDRFVAVGEFAIGEPEHQTVADGVQPSRRPQLGHTVSG
jgi:hypothetical protein